jgi:hypothetical protein
MNRIKFSLACAGALLLGQMLVLADDKPAAATAAPTAVTADQATASLDAVKALAGTWVGDKPMKEGMPPGTIEFKVIAAGSAVAETMLPGTEHEMINMYHLDNGRMLVTHYCAQGVQPRMKLTSANNGVLKFEFLDSTNMKSRDEGHMDSLELTINGDKLSENWAYYKDGKVTSNTVFTFHKKA